MAFGLVLGPLSPGLAFEGCASFLAVKRGGLPRIFFWWAWRFSAHASRMQAPNFG
jgi:hypothetical protein